MYSQSAAASVSQNKRYRDGSSSSSRDSFPAPKEARPAVKAFEGLFQSASGMDAERCMQIGIPVFNNLLILTRRAFYLQILHSFSALALMFKSPPFPHIPRERMRRKRSLAKSLRSLASSSSPRAESSELWSRVGKLLRPLALRKRRTHAQRRGNQFSPRLPPFPHGIILFCAHSNGKKGNN